MQLRIKVVLPLVLLFACVLVRSESMQVYFDSKFSQEVLDFSKGLIGKKFNANVCIPGVEKCKSKRLSQFPLIDKHSPKMIYYRIVGFRQVGQYEDRMILLIETDSNDIILAAEFFFIYDENDFLSRGIFHEVKYNDFKSLKTYLFLLKEYVKSNALSFDEIVSLLDDSGLDLFQKPYMMDPSLVDLRNYRTMAVGFIFEEGSLGARAGLNFMPGASDKYIRVFRGNDNLPVLEYSVNGSYWVSEPKLR